ncbi:MAG: hybrid sensor histidine kinase/response regulator [Hyphomicrobiaceae bacterium]|nr:MAG: hybrid sensor histidine kinase/response regulator [Hyphomicrobiaceae bacterium]
MIDTWPIVTAALAYLFGLFLVAWWGDHFGRKSASGWGRPARYALSLAVYCTSWTFFGSVGLAATTGFDFLPVYIGPVLTFLVGWPLIIRIVRLAKSQNTTSIADFLAARYGKNEALGAVVTIIAVLGILPYLALQLKAVSISVEAILGPDFAHSSVHFAIGDTAFTVAIVMSVFTMLFGTRHIDATEHQDGLMLAIATESVVKLLAFLGVGAFVTWGLFSGPFDLVQEAIRTSALDNILGHDVSPGYWVAVSLLSAVCIIILPRQFHVAVVENNSEREVRRAAWLLPAYLVLINLFVVPIAIAGLIKFPGGTVSADTFVLALPLQAGSPTMTMLAFVGGLSAATAMVIVDCVALAIMVSNNLVLPLVLRRRLSDSPSGPVGLAEPKDSPGAHMGQFLIMVRRVVIVVLVSLAYVFYRTLGQSGGLASIGLLSFAAIAQLAPAFLAALFWRRATARGAIVGILAGFVVWAYTLLLPWMIRGGFFSPSILENGPLGLSLLRPEKLFNVDLQALTHGVVWSLTVNVLGCIIGSLSREPTPIERVQANIFIIDDKPRSTPAFRRWRSSVTVGDLMHTVSRYLGGERTQRSFEEYAQSRNIDLIAHAESDIHILRFTEHLLASAVGAASARLILSLLLRRKSVGNQSALRLLDDASEALQYNRDLLQSALDQVRQGLAVFDKEMQLVCWNRQFRELLDLPSEFGRVGVPLARIIRFLAERGDLGPGDPLKLVNERLYKLAVSQETYQERRLRGRELVLEMRSSSMPQGGIVVTYSDITERVQAAEALERRVKERTAELTKVNQALEEAKAKAEEANLDKTRFLAAASHDILQPLNAARLYATTLVERVGKTSEAALVRNVDTSLEAVEEILATLIEISRLDAGRLEPEISTFPMREVLEQMRVEFAPAAANKSLDLRIVECGAYVRSDRRLLRRVLQNLVSNAIKYTLSGKVLVGCRRRNGTIQIQVGDTGPGIPPEKQALVFKEFERLPETASAVRGLGLGLSIVERIGRVLDHPISLASRPGKGTLFSIAVPRSEPVQAADAAVPTTRIPTGLPVQHLAVVCIDNEQAILEGMRALISNWGCRVEAATTTKDAVALIENGFAPDIVLADYHLDHGTGLEAISALREKMNKRVPAIVITADHSPEVQRQVREAGHAILRKPLKAAALRALLAQLGTEVALRKTAAE